MMETIKEILVVYGRIFTILPLLLVVTLVMGKRSIGELPVFDFLIILTLGAVVGADIADPSIKHLPTVSAIIAIAVLQRVISSLLIKNRLLGRLITFEPTAVVKNGVFLVGNLKRIRYSLDNILQMLRERDIFDLREVELALIEANGKLTVYKKPHKSVVTIEDLGIEKKHESIAYPVIIEGKVDPAILTELNLDEKWLENTLKKKGITDMTTIFFASINARNEIHLSFENDTTNIIPEISH